MPNWLRRGAQAFAGPAGWAQWAHDNRGRPEGAPKDGPVPHPGGRGSAAYYSGYGSRNERRAQYQKGQHGKFDEFGFTDYLPEEEVAIFAQHEAEKIAARRNARLEEGALGALQNGALNLQSRRAGSAMAMMSPFYQNQAQVSLAQRREAPDLMGVYRQNKMEQARRDAKKAQQAAMWAQVGGAVIGAVGTVAGAAMGGGAGGGSLGASLVNAGGQVGSAALLASAQRAGGPGVAGPSAAAQGAVEGALSVASGGGGGSSPQLASQLAPPSALQYGGSSGPAYPGQAAPSSQPGGPSVPTPSSAPGSPGAPGAPGAPGSPGAAGAGGQGGAPSAGGGGAAGGGGMEGGGVPMRMGANGFSRDGALEGFDSAFGAQQEHAAYAVSDAADFEEPSLEYYDRMNKRLDALADEMLTSGQPDETLDSWGA